MIDSHLGVTKAVLQVCQVKRQVAELKTGNRKWPHGRGSFPNHRRRQARTAEGDLPLPSKGFSLCAGWGFYHCTISYMHDAAKVSVCPRQVMAATSGAREPGPGSLGTMTSPWQPRSGARTQINSRSNGPINGNTPPPPFPHSFKGVLMGGRTYGSIRRGRVQSDQTSRPGSAPLCQILLFPIRDKHILHGQLQKHSTAKTFHCHTVKPI